MKVLFLDIDGVLNSAEFYERRVELRNKGKVILAPADPVHHLDSIAIERLNRVLTRTHARIVISSNWVINPLFKSDTQVVDCLIRAGVRAKTPTGEETFLGTTPRKMSLYQRSGEVGLWLYYNKHITDCYAVIDDAFGPMGSIDPTRCVFTDHQTGLLDEHAEELVRILGEEQ